MSIPVRTMPKEKRRGFSGRHIITQSLPAAEAVNRFITGNGTLLLRMTGSPESELVELDHEELQAPQWKNPPKAPLMADHLELIRRKMLDGEYKKAAELADMAASQGGTPPYFNSNPSHPAFLLSVKQPVESADEYLQTLDMTKGEIRVHWEEDGIFERRMFCSRADSCAVLLLTAPEGRLNARIQGIFPELHYEREGWESNDIPSDRHGNWDCIAEAPKVTVCHEEERILFDGVYEYERGGFAGAVVAEVTDGHISVDNAGLRIEGATKALLIMSAERFTDPALPVSSRSLAEKLSALPRSYDTLLKRHCSIHTPIFERLSVDLGGDEEDYLLSTTELKQKQFLSQEMVPAYMEAMVDMGRFFLLADCGKFPPIFGHVNVNINHQISGGNIGNLPEMMESFFRWIEGQLPDARENARRILGTRGFFIACHPDEESGNLFHFNEFYPHEYWISSSGWCLQPFLEHFYCTGDRTFLKERVLPLYAELALLYEDFLTIRDKDGYRMFIPSYSPENFPDNLPCMQVINATMDIQVAREVLTTLLTWGKAADFGTPEERTRWETLLKELPPYRFGSHGELKEWAWDAFEERFDHRHASHLYGCYPGDEVQPDLTPELYRASMIANRMRALGNESCHGVMHRAQAAARLKDAWLVQKLLRFTMEAGYVTDAFTTVHNPYRKNIFPDGQGALPTVLLESLIYSRPGVIELLPALPEGSFRHGCLKGMASRSFAEITEFTWDLDTGHYRLSLRSFTDQELLLRAPGFEERKICLAAGEEAAVEW